MKIWLKVLVALMLVLTCMFSYVACDTPLLNPDGNNNSDSDDENNNGGETANVPGNTAGLENLEEGYRVSFYYSYTTTVTNRNGRREEKNERKLAGTVYLPYDNTGWSAKALAEKDALTYNGYKFDSWYPEWNETTETGWDNTTVPQRAVGDPYAFNTPVTKDINLYAYRGYNVGEDIVWNIVYEYRTDDAIPPESVDENSHLVTFVCVDNNFNIIDKVSLLTVAVTDAEGWTDALIAGKDDLKYNGFKFTKWYTDWDMVNAVPAGEEYTFDAAPSKDIVLYGVKGDHDGSDKLTRKSKMDIILHLIGSGEMYDFANRNAIDVPWYNYRTEITKVVMGDKITSIGRNSFAGFNTLKEIDFSEELTTIGGFAFYEVKSNFLKTIRIPEKVTTIGESAFAYTNLNEVYFSDCLQTIETRAFYGSNKIEFVVVPATLSYVGAAAFHPGRVSVSDFTTAKHALSKVYYNPTDASGNVHKFADITMDIDNEWFNAIPPVYTYKENSGTLTPEEKKSSWYTVTIGDEDYLVQYSFAIKYMLGSALVPIDIDYVDVVPVLVDGKPVLNDKGDAVMLEATITQENIDFKDNLTYNGYRFYSIAGNGFALNLGAKITDDVKVTCKRYSAISNTVNKGYLGGGIVWEFDKTSGILTITPASDEYEGEDKNIAWDLNSADASTLWTGGTNGPASIKSIVIGEGVEYLGSYVFTGASITEILLPESLAKGGIASNAFDNCTSLHAVYYAGTALPEDIKNLNLLGAKAYAKAPESYKGEIGSYWIKDGDATTAWQIDAEGNLYVGGDADMLDYTSASDAPWHDAMASIKSVEVAGNITDIAENLVAGYTNLTSIKLSPQVKSVPESAFIGTGIVNAINKYPNGLLLVDGVLIKVDPARRNNELFVTNTSINVIADGAFSRCDKLKTIFISNTVKYINPNAFDDSDGIEQIFVDQTKAEWDKLAANCNFGDAKVYYKGQWEIENGEYVPKN